MLKKMFKTSDGVQLYIELYGDMDKPLIIWSHGFTGSARNWRSVIRRLNNFRHLVYDLRGHARSSSPDNAVNFSFQRFVLDLIELVQHCGDQQKVRLVGLSFGAMISFKASQMLDSKNKCQVLSSLPDPNDATSLTAKASVFAQAILDQGLEKAGDLYVWGAQSGLGERDAELVKCGFMEHSPVSLAYTLQYAFSQFPASDVMSAGLQQCVISTLLLYGEHDIAAKNYSLRVVNSMGASSNIRHVQIESGGHLLNLTSPDLFCQQLNEFF